MDYIFLGVRTTRSSFKTLESNSTRITESPPLWQQISQPLKCMDIYAGCGGLSEGLHQSGVAKTLWAVSKKYIVLVKTFKST